MAIYFVQIGEDGPVKIGYTTIAGRVPHRVAQLQLACPWTLHVIGVIPRGTVAQEQELHRRFAAARMRGEWFHPIRELTSTARRKTQIKRLPAGIRPGRRNLVK